MKKKSLWIVFFLCLLFVMSACHQKVEVVKEKSGTATVFMHGTPATEKTFTKMEAALAKKGGTVEPTLVVSKKGEVRLDGEWKPAQHPLVAIRFENNNAPDADQAEWLAQVFQYLQKLKVSSINYIAHSQGGVALAVYLAQKQYQTKHPIQIAKVVTLGSPFNELDREQYEDQKLKKSKTWQIIAQGFKDHPVHCGPWLNIAGLVDDISDGIVPLQSVQSIDEILTKKGISVQFKVFNGLEHNDLPIAQSVLHEIENFLQWPVKNT